MKRDLAVKRGLGLEHGQEHFGKTTERVRTTVWPASVQVSGQRVSMEAGSIGARHRPRYRPLSCRTAFRTPFLVKCQVLRVSKVLGHARVSITLDVYRHVLDNERRASVIDLFDAVPSVPLGVPAALN